MNDQSDMPIDVPAIGISLRCPLDDGTGREVVFQGYVPYSCTDDQLNEILDKLARAGERQKSLVLLPTYESELDAKQETLVAETQNLYLATQERDMQKEAWQREAVTSNRRNWKPGSIQVQAMQKLEAAVKQHEQNIRVLEKQIISEQRRISIYKNRLGTGG